MFLAVAPPAPSHSKPAAPAVPGIWVLNQEQTSCSVSLRPAGRPQQVLTFHIDPAMDAWGFSVAGEIPRIGALHREVEIGVSFLPNATRLASTAMLVRDPDTNEELISITLPSGPPEQFAGAAGLLVEAKGREHVQIELPDTQKAFDDLRTCNEALLMRWGLNPQLLSSLSRKPRPMNGVQMVNPVDYPEVSINRREQGATTVRFSIGPDGRVKGCAPLISSGFPALDAQSCRSLIKRGRFEPALDQNGRPITTESVTTIHWALGY